MKVALLTSGNSELSRSLIGSLKARSDVELIVVHTRRLASDSWRNRVKTQAYIALRKRFLNEEHPGVPISLELPNAVYSPDINSQITHQSLHTFRPDLIIISGTKKVEKRLLETAKLAVNLHHGFLPTYRGVSSLDCGISPQSCACTGRRTTSRRLLCDTLLSRTSVSFSAKSLLVRTWPH